MRKLKSTMGFGKMMDFTLMLIVTITLVLNFSPSAYSDSSSAPHHRLTGRVEGEICAGVAMVALLVVAVCIKWGFYRKNKVLGESSSQRDVEPPRQTGRAWRSTLEKSDSLGAPDTTSRRDEKLATATDYQAAALAFVDVSDGESQLPNQPQGASDGDKNANAGGGVSTGNTTMEGGIDLGSSNFGAPVLIGTNTINFMHQMLKNAVGGGGSIVNTNIEGG